MLHWTWVNPVSPNQNYLWNKMSSSLPEIYPYSLYYDIKKLSYSTIIGCYLKMT